MLIIIIFEKSKKSFNFLKFTYKKYIALFHIHFFIIIIKKP